MYSQDEIKKVLWNTFQETVSKIEYIGNNIYHVYPDIDATLDDIANISEELYDTELFDITLEREYLVVEYLGEYVLEKKQFLFINENLNETITFTDDQIKYVMQRYNTLHSKYHNDNFFAPMVKKLQKNKKLSKKQNDQLQFLIKNGKSMYEAGVLTTKN